MVSRALPVVTPPPVLRTDWETVTRLASTWSKPLDLHVCPTLISLRQFYDATDKPKPVWFWVPNQDTVTVILRPKSSNRSRRFWDLNSKTLHHLGFEAQPKNPPPVLRSNRRKLSQSVLRPNYRKLSPPVLRSNRRKPSPSILRWNQIKPSPPILRPNQRKPSPPVLRSNRRKTSQWFWGQTTDKPSRWFWG
jgi:hypothetical protein